MQRKIIGKIQYLICIIKRGTVSLHGCERWRTLTLSYYINVKNIKQQPTQNSNKENKALYHSYWEENWLCPNQNQDNKFLINFSIAAVVGHIQGLEPGALGLHKWTLKSNLCLPGSLKWQKIENRHYRVKWQLEHNSIEGMKTKECWKMLILHWWRLEYANF